MHQCGDKIASIILNILLTNDQIDLNYRFNGASPLIYALKNKFPRCALLLASDKRVEVNIKLPEIVDKKLAGTTALMLALMGSECMIAVTEYLLSEREKLHVKYADSSGLTPLMAACSTGHTYAVAELLKLDQTMILARNKFNETAFYYAVFSKNIDIINMLLQHENTDEELINNKSKHNYTALSFAAKLDRTAIALKILDSGMCDVNIPTEDGDTALIFAVRNKNVNLVAELLKHGADPNLVNGKGNRALDEAVKISDKVDRDTCSIIVDLLLNSGADINPKNPKTGVSTIELAASEKNNLVAIRLLQRESNSSETAVDYLRFSLFNRLSQSVSQDESAKPKPFSISI